MVGHLSSFICRKCIYNYLYVGIKGKLEDGTDAPEDDFLAREGLEILDLGLESDRLSNESDARG